MIGAIADDFTGATDVAVAFRRAGMRVSIVFGPPVGLDSIDEVAPDPALDPAPDPAPDVIVVALKSRTIATADAVAQSLAAARWLQSQGCDRFYFKYCSTFDSSPAGNIGPVADALADHLGAGIVVATPASPVHGRTVYQGTLFVGEQLLSESPMRRHPLTPMTDSNLVRVLSAQTPRQVGLVPHAVIAAGSAAIADSLERMHRAGTRYAVADAIDDADLAELGRAVSSHVLVTGAAGLAAGVAAALAAERDAGAAAAAPIRSAADGPTTADRYRTPAVLAGSCSARTLEQVALFRRSNPSFRLDAVATPDAAALADAALAWFDSLERGPAPLIYSSVEPQALRAAQEALGAALLADVIETAMARIATGLVERGVERLVVAGGETSGSVTSALGVRAGVVGDEEAPGVPWIFAEQPRRLALLLKSGNFGDPELLLRASARHGGHGGQGSGDDREG
ncbi:four-carbon acid sugar kinase family protein [Microbacterium sp. STN6]|uniref:3-oxo-tetronate kinase n=1 Tax=Microbacterium sp. STN6 TaxID=2995588 RepID=UPI002260CB96|nr:3-oxo-tetronate kinase [Microbacterium sp. STN6]MCX7520907.1 four-carbon acid sugar kinase family protein [Microbacterium sp. STN6]